MATVLPGPGGWSAAWVRRRALSRVQPVTATTSPSTAPLVFFVAFLYALAYFVVISARVAIDSSLPIVSEGPPFRGQKYVRHRGWLAGCLSESGRRVAGRGLTHKTRKSAQVAELTVWMPAPIMQKRASRPGPINRPEGMRVIARRERPHPGALLRLTDHNGWRITCFATNARGPGWRLPPLEVRDHQRGRCEDPGPMSQRRRWA